MSTKFGGYYRRSYPDKKINEAELAKITEDFWEVIDKVC